ncbi:hypothetical protein D1155_01100 [Anaerotruncus sp. 80]|uniref:Amidohydrolase 3 domain-containing protein n=2 Tax=Oscillospiraceae TaxID=216572 RepID=A0A845QF78_9FIRM|nr:hypothetical protein [Anaerotruncus colihominis]NCF00924.1 hypothetical protein [Anaerotruncus sp. 80]
MYDLIIKNGMLIDGTGSERYQADIGVKDGQIAKIGILAEADSEAIIDAKGQFVTPGFIDMHSHADVSIFMQPDAENLIGQGVTSAFTGHCGMGMTPLDKYWTLMHVEGPAYEEMMPFSTIGHFPGEYPAIDVPTLKAGMKKCFGINMSWKTFGEYQRYLREQGVAVNLFMIAGHSNMRQNAMGLHAERPATEAELLEMEYWVKEAMEAGAFGISYGLDYTPGWDADDEELLRLAECLKPYDGILTAHVQMRNHRHGKTVEDHRTLDGVKELMEIGLKTGVHVHVSHIEAADELDDEKAIYESEKETLKLIEVYRKKGVRATWDVSVPNLYAMYYFSDLSKVLLYYVTSCGGKKAFGERLKSEGYREYLAECINRNENIVFPRWNDQAVIGRCACKEWEGKRICDIAEALETDSAHALIEILARDPETRYIQPIAPSLAKPQSERFYEAKEACIGTDNMATNYDFEGDVEDMPKDNGTPSGFCGIIEYINSRLERGYKLETVVGQLTGNAAKVLGLTKRGYLKEGMQADIVIADLENLKPNKNMVDPRSKPEGISYVLVNGKVAMEHGNHSHVRSGMIERYADR